MFKGPLPTLARFAPLRVGRRRRGRNDGQTTEEVQGDGNARHSNVGKLAIIAAGLRSAVEIAEHSRSALDRPLVCDAELWLAVATDEARIWGAFQRAVEANPALPGVRRGSGGP